MAKKRRLDDIGCSSQQGGAKSADWKSSGDAYVPDAHGVSGGFIGPDEATTGSSHDDEFSQCTSLASTHGVTRGSVSSGEATKGSSTSGDSTSCFPECSKAIVLYAGNRATETEEETEDREPALLPSGCLFSTGPLANSDPLAGEVLVIVLPTRHFGAQRVVSYEIFAQGLRKALFGPTTETERSTLWTSNPGPTIPSKEYFIAGHDKESVGAPVRFAVVHVKSRYSLYLLSHKSGLAYLAHAEGQNTRTSVDIFNRNRGLIREAVHRLLMTEQHVNSHAVCGRCGGAADWAASCCPIKLCSYCLPREFLLAHLARSSCEPCSTTLHQLKSSPDPAEDGWLCSRKLLVQVEEELNNITRQKDVFLFCTYCLLEDIQDLRPAKKKIVMYHMRPNGTLKTVVTIGDRDLSFLW